MKTIDLGDGVCIGSYESYLKLKQYFNKFIHIIDYPNFKKIDEGVGNFLVLNSEEFEHVTIRELDKFSYCPIASEAETIFINTDDINAGSVIAVFCKTTRNHDFFKSMAEVAEKVYKDFDKIPLFSPSQMEPALKYFRRLIGDKERKTKQTVRST
jgi:hypothetical protein